MTKMLNEMHSTKTQIGRAIWVIGILLSILLINFAANVAMASSHEWTSPEDMPSLAVQNTATPGPALQLTPTSTYSFSLATLGYDEITLTSPYDSAQYSFRMPGYWIIESDGILDLDLSYVYNQITTEGYPALFGDLTVTLDNQTLKVFSIDQKELDHYRLRVALPSSLLANPDRIQHDIGLTFDAGFLCEIPHKAKLVIHPTSSISLNYSQYPLAPDLSRYPWPFYQRAFEPDSVRFVLPSVPTASDLSSGLAIAAKLGDLTGNHMVISATTDLDLGHLLSSASAPLDEHFVVIGQPHNNQLLPLLEDVADLPVSLHRRQLELVTRGPAGVAPGDTFTYTFTITNTLDRDLNLSLIDPLPAYTELIGCTLDCAENSDDNVVTWRDRLLTPDEAISLSLTLKAADVLTGTACENTVTLLETDLGPVNADTLTAPVVADSSNTGPQVSVASEGDYFFVYEGRAVAKGDGVVQEISSPWSENRAILIITGLSDEAVRKASQAMSSETRFPGMSGTVALVRDALLPSEIKDAASAAIEMTFADLGYQDKVIQGISSQQVDYFFQIPYGWRLADDAAIDLAFSHSQLIDYEDSGLTVLLNAEPVASIALSEETARDGHIHINLAEANVRTVESNRLTVQVNLSLLEKCANPNSEQAWLLIRNTSKIFLPHSEDTGLTFDLDYFPYPFDANPGLTDLLFALPEAPTVGEWELALRLAAYLGNSASGKTIIPAVMMGSDLPSERLGNYHIVAIGRPSRNALIQQVNNQLPQPFLPGSDEIEQRLDDVLFRLPPGIDLGYLQLIPSPWNEMRVFLAATGTTDESVKGAIRILTDRPWALKGDLALIRGDSVKTIDTRELTSSGLAMTVATVVPEMTPVASNTPTAIATPPSRSPTPDVSAAKQNSDAADLPPWLLPLVGMNGLIIIAISAFVFWKSRH
jgi:uncharacterized repeat protein (TIGR01451 family)